METPEIEFLQYLLRRFIEIREIDIEKTSVKSLLKQLDDELTPIGGG